MDLWIRWKIKLFLFIFCNQKIHLDPGSGPHTILLDCQIVLVHRHPGWDHLDVEDDDDTDIDDRI